MRHPHLSDEQWALIAPLLPPAAHTGRPRADDRRTLDAILFVLRTGCRWQDLPPEYGSATTAWRRLKRWEAEGVWERIWRTLLSTLDAQGKLGWAQAFLDGSFVPAKKGGLKVGLTRKGKGTKWMLVVDAQGTPIGFQLESAQKHELTLAESTLRTIRVRRARGGHARCRPKKLIADRAYDSIALRRALKRRNIQVCVPPIRRAHRRSKPGGRIKDRTAEYRCRWIIERTFAWLGNYRRLLVRWERQIDVYQGFFTLALVLICLRRVLQ